MLCSDILCLRKNIIFLLVYGVMFCSLISKEFYVLIMIFEVEDYTIYAGVYNVIYVGIDDVKMQ